MNLTPQRYKGWGWGLGLYSIQFNTVRLRQENRQASLLFELENLLFTAEEYEAVIASYDQVLKIKPDYHEAWKNRGIARLNLGRNEEAITSYDQALKFKADDYEACNGKGHVLGKLGRNEEAIASYDQVLKIKPDDHEAWYYQGAALIKLGRWREGNNSISKANEINPDFVRDIFHIQKKQIIASLLQKLGLQKLVQIWTFLLTIIGFRR